MSERLYVGGLDPSVYAEVLSELFGQFGNVRSARVMSDPRTGQSRGFGFVEMFKPAEAKKAIDSLHGSIYEKRTMTVTAAASNATLSGRTGGSVAQRVGRPGTAGDARNRLRELGRAASAKGQSKW